MDLVKEKQGDMLQGGGGGKYIGSSEATQRVLALL